MEKIHDFSELIARVRSGYCWLCVEPHSEGRLTCLFHRGEERIARAVASNFRDSGGGNFESWAASSSGMNSIARHQSIPTGAELTTQLYDAAQRNSLPALLLTLAQYKATPSLAGPLEEEEDLRIASHEVTEVRNTMLREFKRGETDRVSIDVLELLDNGFVLEQTQKGLFGSRVHMVNCFVDPYGAMSTEIVETRRG